MAKSPGIVCFCVLLSSVKVSAAAATAAKSMRRVLAPNSHLPLCPRTHVVLVCLCMYSDDIPLAAVDFHVASGLTQHLMSQPQVKAAVRHLAANNTAGAAGYLHVMHMQACSNGGSVACVCCGVLWCDACAVTLPAPAAPRVVCPCTWVCVAVSPVGASFCCAKKNTCTQLLPG